MTDDKPTPGPNIIGATGGSGTRVLARIVRGAGMYIGTDLNRYEDALPFGAYSDRWIDTYMEGAAEAEPVRAQMRAELDALVAAHCRNVPADAASWGWKEPRSIYLLPFLADALPSLRFVHFLRDGRDMAFSDNQQQVRKHGTAVLGRWRHRLDRPLRSVTLWARVNTRAADFGERQLGPERYLRIRFEDLCSNPGTTVRTVFDFFGLEGDAEALGAAEVKPPATLGRWRDEPAAKVEVLERAAGDALERFGYLER